MQSIAKQIPYFSFLYKCKIRGIGVCTIDNTFLYMYLFNMVNIHGHGKSDNTGNELAILFYYSGSQLC